MDLSQEIDRLSWRRFLVLLHGLGPNSVFLHSIAAKQPRNPAHRAAGPVIEDPQEAEKVLVGWLH